MIKCPLFQPARLNVIQTVKFIACKSLQHQNHQNSAAQGEDRGKPALSHGKVTQGIREMEMEMKECGNINLSFVKH